MNVLFITGIPAAGKTTVMRRLHQFYPAVWGILDHIGHHRPFDFRQRGYIELVHYIIERGIAQYETFMKLRYLTLAQICRSELEFKFVASALSGHRVATITLYGDPEVLIKRAFNRQSNDPERCGGYSFDFYRKRIYDLYEVFKSPEPWHGIRIDTSALTKDEVCETVRDICENVFGPAPGIDWSPLRDEKDIQLIA